MQRNRMTNTLALAALFTAGVTVTACGQPRPYNQGYSGSYPPSAVCVDPRTNNRLPEDYCDDDDDRYRGGSLMFIPYGHVVPTYGQSVSGAYSSKSAAASNPKPSAVKSSSTTRGGFGSTASSNNVSSAS